MIYCEVAGWWYIYLWLIFILAFVRTHSLPKYQLPCKTMMRREARFPDSLYPKAQVFQFHRKWLTSLTRKFAGSFNGGRTVRRTRPLQENLCHRMKCQNLRLGDLMGRLLPKINCLTWLSKMVSAMMAIFLNPQLLCLVEPLLQIMCKLQLLQPGLHCHTDAWLGIFETHCDMIIIFQCALFRTDKKPGTYDKYDHQNLAGLLFCSCQIVFMVFCFLSLGFGGMSTP